MPQLVIKSLFSSDCKDNLLSVANHNPNQSHILKPVYILDKQIPLRNRYHPIAVNKVSLLVAKIHCLSVQLMFFLCCCSTSWQTLVVTFSVWCWFCQESSWSSNILDHVRLCVRDREERRFLLLCKFYFLKFQKVTLRPTSPTLPRSRLDCLLSIQSDQ